MTTATAEKPVVTVEEAPDEMPAPRRWTRDEYYRMAESGVIGPEERVELIEGEIVQKVSPQLTPHAIAVEKTNEALLEAFGRGYRIRPQLPMTMSDTTEPEPDFLVCRKTPTAKPTSHPGAAEAVLVVEISDSTLRFDQGRKARLYAAGGVVEYWIVNLQERQVEVYTEPTADAGYLSTRIYLADAAVPVTAIDGRSVAVADLLP